MPSVMESLPQNFGWRAISVLFLTQVATSCKSMRNEKEDYYFDETRILGFWWWKSPHIRQYMQDGGSVHFCSYRYLRSPFQQLQCYLLILLNEWRTSTLLSHSYHFKSLYLLRICRTKQRNPSKLQNNEKSGKERKT